MNVDPAFFSAIGDVFLNLSAGWFGAAVILPGTYPRTREANAFYIIMNVALGLAALALGYKLRILGI